MWSSLVEEVTWSSVWFALMKEVTWTLVLSFSRYLLLRKWKDIYARFLWLARKKDILIRVSDSDSNSCLFKVLKRDYQIRSYIQCRGTIGLHSLRVCIQLATYFRNSRPMIVLEWSYSGYLKGKKNEAMKWINDWLNWTMKCHVWVAEYYLPIQGRLIHVPTRPSQTTCIIYTMFYSYTTPQTIFHFLDCSLTRSFNCTIVRNAYLPWLWKLSSAQLSPD